jgi:hypothetical protein
LVSPDIDFSSSIPIVNPAKADDRAFACVFAAASSSRCDFATIKFKPLPFRSNQEATPV